MRIAKPLLAQLDEVQLDVLKVEDKLFLLVRWILLVVSKRAKAGTEIFFFAFRFEHEGRCEVVLVAVVADQKVMIELRFGNGLIVFVLDLVSIIRHRRARAKYKNENEGESASKHFYDPQSYADVERRLVKIERPNVINHRAAASEAG